MHTAISLKGILRRIVPARCRAALWHFGFRRYCPCCRSYLRGFLPGGIEQRPDAECPVCYCMERHRLAYLYLRARTSLFDGHPKRILHFAPEPEIARIFQNLRSVDYLSADLYSPAAMAKIDVTDIPYPDNHFDVIFCSHVLCCVSDDRKAIAELRRVLREDGWAILQVPIHGERTVEDPSATTPGDRMRAFGHPEMARRYGADYRERLAAAGFIVTVDDYVKSLGPRRIKRYGLAPNENIYFCRKSSLPCLP